MNIMSIDWVEWKGNMKRGKYFESDKFSMATGLEFLLLVEPASKQWNLLPLWVNAVQPVYLWGHEFHEAWWLLTLFYENQLKSITVELVFDAKS